MYDQQGNLLRMDEEVLLVPLGTPHRKERAGLLKLFMVRDIHACSIDKKFDSRTTICCDRRVSIDNFGTPFKVL
eukprot:12897359-Prorocentrum_lima.AAC.1